MAMRGYDRDEYEDLDEYEEEDEEQEEGGGEEEYEEEETHQPTKEELEYLELRHRLKEDIRKQLKKKSGSANFRENKNKLPSDNYGSFFGPSQPVIAQRVIQESKSLLENQHLAAKVSRSHNGNNKSHSSTTARPQPQVNGHLPKVKNELQVKAQRLKDTRDYSFLLSDDIELPAPRKDPLPRNVSVSRSEARSAQMPSKSKQLLSNSGRQVSNGREERKPTSHVSNGREERRPTSHVSNGREERRPTSHVSNGREERRPMSKSTHMPPKAGSHRLTSVAKPNRTIVDSRKQLGSNSGNEPRRPLGSKVLPAKKPAAVMEKKGAILGAKSSTAGLHKPPSSKLQYATPKQSIDSRKEFHESSKGRVIPKHPVSSSKPQMNKVLPKTASRATLQEERPKKKPVRRYSDDEDDGDEAISMIRQMFGYDPKKFAGRDEDDSDMEANYADIMKEEKRSALIARKEDEEELRKIEEEERLERLRKKRKLSQR